MLTNGFEIMLRGGELTGAGLARRRKQNLGKLPAFSAVRRMISPESARVRG